MTENAPQGQDLYSNVDLPKPTDTPTEASETGGLVAVPVENIPNVSELHHGSDESAGALDASSTTDTEQDAKTGDE